MTGQVAATPDSINDAIVETPARCGTILNTRNKKKLRSELQSIPHGHQKEKAPPSMRER
jgi:hypothetical protein